MKTQLATKMRNTQGFILAEQLISIIFIGLLCVAVTAGLGAAMTAFANITQKTESQALLNRAVQEVSDEYAFSHDPIANTQYISGTLKVPVTLGNQTIEGSQGIILSGIGIATGITQNGVETVLLVPEIGGLVPVISDVVFNDQDSDNPNTWTFTVTVTQNGRILAEVKDMTVARVGQ